MRIFGSFLKIYKLKIPMKIFAVLNSLLIMFQLSCKKKEKVLEPEYILKSWASSTENLNYTEYIRYEAYPKSPDVFKEIYRDYYIKNIVVGKIGNLDNSKVIKDHRGKSYYKISVDFEATEYRRANGRSVNHLSGEVDLIKFIDNNKYGSKWLMSNRTLIRVNR